MSLMDGNNETCTWPMQELGRLDGLNALGKEGAIFGKVQEYIDSEHLKRQWPRIGEYIHKIREDVFGKQSNSNIEFKCSLTLWDPKHESGQNADDIGD